MNEQELFLSNGKSAKVFYCGECRIVHRTKDQAIKCCKPNICDCGAECERHYTACELCRTEKKLEKEKARFEAAVTIESKDYDGFVFDIHGAGFQDGYFQSISDCIEDYENEDLMPPDYVYCCSPEALKLDLSDAIDCLSDDGYEGMHDYIQINESLSKAVEEFNKLNENVLTAWSVDYSRKIILPPPLTKVNDEI